MAFRKDLEGSQQGMKGVTESLGRGKKGLEL